MADTATGKLKVFRQHHSRKAMKPVERQTPSGSFWHGVNNLLTALAILSLLWSLLELLWRRKSTAWLATALLFFVPVWLGVGFLVCESYWLVTDKCLTSDFAIGILTIISAVISLVVALWSEFGDGYGARFSHGASNRPLVPLPVFKVCE